jgi:putative endonuclease
MRSYYVYIIMNRSGMPYTGFTNSLQHRVRQHRDGEAGFTARYRVTKQVYYEVTDDVWAAIAREKQIKGWTHDKKIALIRCQNPAMKDLAPELFGWRAAQFSVKGRTAQGRRSSVSRSAAGQSNRAHRQILPSSG